ncbi:MAG: tRNA (adenosine(37)-N6)-threonylcarbamoyltransferase complex transferase subunit TsaD [Gemmatimonadetes bacterium]|nr:tRNA (adenosine(37)-N6)-threonylcarbamoyltransferase complex transferase subunit TsaD [Gemmatimonadota bacterium]
MRDSLVLGIETSCDETSAAVLRGERELLSHIIASQDVHAVYGGVVPEIAARQQLRDLSPVVRAALVAGGLELRDVGAIAVTAGPGLIGSLLVGVNWAKGAAYALGLPLVAVHHMEAHLFAPNLESPDAEPPFVGLLVSGGHTLLVFAAAWRAYRVLGQTRDDAAGEAFDKVGRLLGLPYPGGPQIERLAREGDPRRHAFPVPMVRGDQRAFDPDFYDFSFSGLKTAVLLRVRALEAEGRLAEELPHLCASFQAAAIESLVVKTVRAVEETGASRVVLGGGVARNQALVDALRERLGAGVEIFVPSPRLATDNAAMVARAGAFHWHRGDVAGLDLNPDPNLPFPGLA